MPGTITHFNSCFLNFSKNSQKMNYLPLVILMVDLFFFFNDSSLSTKSFPGTEVWKQNKYKYNRVVKHFKIWQMPYNTLWGIHLGAFGLIVLFLILDEIDSPENLHRPFPCWCMGSNMNGCSNSLSTQVLRVFWPLAWDWQPVKYLCICFLYIFILTFTQ